MMRRGDPTPIDPDSLAALSDAELAELAEKLELLHLDEQRNDIVAFALNTEVPGTPSPYSENDRIKLLKRKEEMRREKISDTEYDDAEDVEPEEPDGEFYPARLEVVEHQQMILEVMQALVEEEPVVGPLSNGFENRYADGVILMFPPGASKSTYASVVAPAWIAGRYPNTDIISLSYGADLARRFGRRVRHIARSERYHQQFGATVVSDNQAVDQWSLTNGSTYKAVGILGGVTGSRADVCVCDDLLAGREEAESDIIREKTWQALKDDVLTRLKPRGKICVIATRWHEDDPIGRILGEDWDGQSGLWEGTDGRLWLVLCVPLIADRDDDPLGRPRGAVLWPEWFDEKHVQFARAQGERSWNSLYQQRPSASDGNILLKSMWRCWPHGKSEPTDEQRAYPERTEPPEFGKWKQCVLVYDTAIEDGEDDDYSAMTAWVTFETTKKLPQRKMAEEKMQNVLMIGAWRKKIQAADLIDTVLAHIKHFQPDRIVIEKRASGNQLIQELRKRRPRHQYGEVIIEAWLPPGPPGLKGKKPRAHAASLSLAEGSVWYMPGQMTEYAVKEAASFPNGRHDDLTDTITCLISYARTTNLLEITHDALSDQEIHEIDEEKVMALTHPKASYGNMRSKPYTQAARSLYGRSQRA
jgi:phage terminase large subunit-like protein